MNPSFWLRLRCALGGHRLTEDLTIIVACRCGKYDVFVWDDDE